MRAPSPILVATLGCLVGCSPWAPPRTPGPNYSTIPCADNCGNDSQCVAKCTPASNNPPPPALLK